MLMKRNFVQYFFLLNFDFDLLIPSRDIKLSDMQKTLPPTS